MTLSMSKVLTVSLIVVGGLTVVLALLTDSTLQIFTGIILLVAGILT